MGLKLDRRKDHSLLASGLYRLNHLALRVLGERRHFAMTLDLEWLVHRFAHEASHRHYAPDAHPLRAGSTRFLATVIEPSYRALDIGCGAGFVADALARLARVVVAIDHDAASVATARARFGRPGLTFVVGDAFEYVAAQSDPFDVIVLSHVLEHLDDPRVFLEKCRPLARFVYIEVPDFEATPLNRYRVDLGRKLVHTDPDHVSEFDRDELSTIIQAAGLVILRTDFRNAVLRYWCKAQ